LAKPYYNFEALLSRKPIVLDENAIEAQIKGKNILITGAAGSIGSEIARQVLRFKPASVILLDQAETPLYFLERELSEYHDEVKLHTILCDITHKKALEEVFKKYAPHIVYHAAAYKHVPMLENNPVQAVLVNVLGTKNVADLVEKHQTETFVLISTDKAVNPGSVMGASKLIAEKYVQALHDKIERQTGVPVKFITTRFGNVLGSNGSVLPVFAEQIQNGGPITLTHPDIERYFMTIAEACGLVLEAGAMGKGAEIYTFYMGNPVRIKDLALKMIEMAGLAPGAIDIIITGLRPGEKLNEELLGERTRIVPTHNEFIMIAVEDPVDFLLALKSIETMTGYAQEYKFEETVAEMKKFLPDFRSKNSKYQILDNNSEM